MLSSAPHQTGQLRRLATRIPTICVVDPQAEDYHGWDSLARANGLRLQFVASAEQALRFARVPTAVDLWVVNTELPGLSGCELCSMLKFKSPQTAMYLVADDYSAAVEQSAWQSRASLFGCKPLNIEWVESWLANRRNAQP